MNLQPALPASLIQWMVRRVDSSRLNQPGSALTAAALYFLRTGAMVMVEEVDAKSSDAFAGLVGWL